MAPTRDTAGTQHHNPFENMDRNRESNAQLVCFAQTLLIPIASLIGASQVFNNVSTTSLAFLATLCFIPPVLGGIAYLGVSHTKSRIWEKEIKVKNDLLAEAKNTDYVYSGKGIEPDYGSRVSDSQREDLRRQSTNPFRAKPKFKRPFDFEL